MFMSEETYKGESALEGDIKVPKLKRSVFV